MAQCRIGMRAGLVVAATVALLWAAPAADAQQAAGVHVNADGVLTKQVVPDPTGRLIRQRIAAAQAALDPEVARKSPLRKVSLNRLEKAIADRLQLGGQLPDEMRYLAGLTRIEYVFFYPESGDIVVAGPAEGWVTDLTGRVRGMNTGRPTLLLEDLAVALRAYPPAGNRGGVIGCSIDPTPEGLAKMQEFLQKFGPRATPRDTQFIVNSLRNAMGMQTISINGVHPQTHFAQVMVEADYRMKLIGIGLEKPPVKLESYVERASASQVARNALQRWYFTPNYECVRVSDDAHAMQLVGEGVKLVGEDEVVAAGGQRRVAARGNRASQQFVNNFTRVYPELAEKEPVYAQLRNLIDMAIAAAFIQQQDYYGKSGWTMPVLGNEEKFQVRKYHAPKQVETVVTSVWKGNRLMTPLGGGVTILAHHALDSDNLLPDEDGQVGETRSTIKLDLAAGQWWWD